MYQITINELNGNFVELIEVDRDTEPKDVANLAQAKSAEENGYIVVAGQNLQATDETTRVIQAVAVSGQLINQSLYSTL